ncbi:MAG: hypothetical protein JWL61_3640 [Gemmatimonadetes bacterium]|nr:hypothetical protein [Gemmatimonadota bacterium]
MSSHSLSRFVDAQRGVYANALLEITRGRKESHWMWFVFPQLVGLGQSAMAQRYGITGVEEARAYVAHPVLGPRLQECMEAALGVEGRTATEIFGRPDDRKLQSCATLFAAVTPPGSVFERLLAKYYDAERDERTLQLLALG